MAGSNCEEVGYDALISVTDDAQAGEISLVTSAAVRTFAIAPVGRAAEIVAAAAARVDAAKIHQRAGGAEARRTKRALIGLMISACVFAAVYIVRVGGEKAVDRVRADRRAHEVPTKGRCLDLQGLVAPCAAADAIFVVLGPRDMRGCPTSSPILVSSIARTQTARRELSRLCIDTNKRKRE